VTRHSDVLGFLLQEDRGKSVLLPSPIERGLLLLSSEFTDFISVNVEFEPSTLTLFASCQ